METPDPLYEALSFHKQGKICLVCGNDWAHSVLRTTTEEIIFLCKGCSIRWNWYGYGILRTIKPKELISNLLKFKFWHPFSSQSPWVIYHNVQKMRLWGKKMRKYLK